MKLDDSGIVDTQPTPVLSGQQTQEQWENKRIGDAKDKSKDYFTPQELTFIRTLLASSRTEVIKEMMGKMEKKNCDECGKQDCEGVYEYNNAIDDVLALLEKEMNETGTQN